MPEELIVITKPNADISQLNSTMESQGAVLDPIFGPSKKIARMDKNAMEVLNKQGIYPETFFIAKRASDLKALHQQLKDHPLVDSAYIKPPTFPAMMMDDGLVPVNPDGPTPSFYSMQGYLFDPPDGINARLSWRLEGGYGEGVKIIDIEGAWQFSHEDLQANIGGMIAGEQIDDLLWRNHGTAVIGELGGDENDYGIVGICPRAFIRCVSMFGIGSAKAIVMASDALDYGDLLLIELQRPGPFADFMINPDQDGYMAIEWWPDDFAAILYATSKGVIVVEAAGNGGVNFDDSLLDVPMPDFPSFWGNPLSISGPLSGAIIVGAGAPPPGTNGNDNGPDRSRLSFSCFGERVDAQGWGAEVVTCGYGELQGGDFEPYWYTDDFGGTSSASPIVTGALALVQGRLRYLERPVLSPARAREILRTTGSPQQEGPDAPLTQRIGNRPELREIFMLLDIIDDNDTGSDDFSENFIDESMP